VAALVQAAADASREALALAGTRYDPGMPLAGYLLPLRNVSAALTATAGTAAHMATLAEVIIVDPQAATAARRGLRQAARRTYWAASEAGSAADEARLALRTAGADLPRADESPGTRRARATARALEQLTGEARTALRSPLPHLAALERVTVTLAAILMSLEQACWQMRPGIIGAYGQLQPRPLASRHAAIAKTHIDQGTAVLRNARTTTNQASRTISETLAWHRKMSLA
jgi:hypothetical protein